MARTLKRTIGDDIISLRLARGWSYRDLATATGITEDAVRKLERGDREPSLRTAKALAQALGVSLDELAAAL